jgi:adenylate cyclase
MELPLLYSQISPGKLLFQVTAYQFGAGTYIAYFRTVEQTLGLGASGHDRHNYIATVPKRGYRLLVSPVRVADIPVPESPGKTGRNTFTRGRSRFLYVGTGVVIALALLLVYAVRQSNGPLGPVDDAGIGLERQDKPAIAVLPFTNLSDDKDQQYFSDGMTEDIIAGLSKLSGLRVTARNSAFAFAGNEAEPEQVAELLGVRYLLQGSVRRSGQRIRVTARLIDAESGMHLWADHFDGDLQDLFTLQDQVAEQTAMALLVSLTAQERERLAVRPVTNYAAYDFYLRGRVIYGSLSRQENALARRMYQRALEQDPRFALAYTGLALTYIDDFRSGWDRQRRQLSAKALKLAQKAVSLDASLPQAHFVLGFVYLYGHADHDRAVEKAKEAIRLDPNYADAYALLSSAYFFAGQPDKTLELDRQAIRLNPASSFIYQIHLGRSYYFQGRYQDALKAFMIAASKNYDYLPNHLWLAATYARLGDVDEAQWEKEQVMTLDPTFDLARWLATRPYKHASQRNRLREGLEAAGLAVKIESVNPSQAP